MLQNRKPLDQWARDYKRRNPQFLAMDNRAMAEAYLRQHPEAVDEIDIPQPVVVPDTWIGPKPTKPLESLKGFDRFKALQDAPRRGLMETAGAHLTEFWRKTPVLASVAGAAQLVRAAGTAQKISRGQKVSDDDLMAFNTWSLLQERMQDATVGSKIMDTVTDSMRFVAEIALAKATFGGTGAAFIKSAALKKGAMAAAKNAAKSHAAGVAGGAVKKHMAYHTAYNRLMDRQFTTKMSRAVFDKLVKQGGRRFGSDKALHMASKALVYGADTGISAIALSPAPVMWARALEESQQWRLKKIFEGKEGPDAVEAALMGFVGSAIELTSAYSGIAFASGVGAVVQSSAGAAVKAKMSGAFEVGRFMSDLVGRNTPQAVKHKARIIAGLANNVILRKGLTGRADKLSRMLSYYGMQNTVQEMMAERGVDFLRGLTGFTGDDAGLFNAVVQVLNSVTDMERMGVEMVAFTIPGIVTSNFHKAKDAVSLKWNPENERQKTARSQLAPAAERWSEVMAKYALQPPAEQAAAVVDLFGIDSPVADAFARDDVRSGGDLMQALEATAAQAETAGDSSKASTARNLADTLFDLGTLEMVDMWGEFSAENSVTGMLDLLGRTAGYNSLALGMQTYAPEFTWESMESSRGVEVLRDSIDQIRRFANSRMGVDNPAQAEFIARSASQIMWQDAKSRAEADVIRRAQREERDSEPTGIPRDEPPAARRVTTEDTVEARHMEVGETPAAVPPPVQMGTPPAPAPAAEAPTAPGEVTTPAVPDAPSIELPPVPAELNSLSGVPAETPAAVAPMDILGVDAQRPNRLVEEAQAVLDTPGISAVLRGLEGVQHENLLGSPSNVGVPTDQVTPSFVASRLAQIEALPADVIASAMRTNETVYAQLVPMDAEGNADWWGLTELRPAKIQLGEDAGAVELIHEFMHLTLPLLPMKHLHSLAAHINRRHSTVLPLDNNSLRRRETWGTRIDVAKPGESPRYYSAEEIYVHMGMQWLATLGFGKGQLQQGVGSLMEADSPEMASFFERTLAPLAEAVYQARSSPGQDKILTLAELGGLKFRSLADSPTVSAAIMTAFLPMARGGKLFPPGEMERLTRLEQDRQAQIGAALDQVNPGNAAENAGIAERAARLWTMVSVNLAESYQRDALDRGMLVDNLAARLINTQWTVGTTDSGMSETRSLQEMLTEVLQRMPRVSSVLAGENAREAAKELASDEIFIKDVVSRFLEHHGEQLRVRNLTAIQHQDALVRAEALLQGRETAEAEAMLDTLTDDIRTEDEKYGAVTLAELESLTDEQLGAYQESLFRQLRLYVGSATRVGSSMFNLLSGKLTNLGSVMPAPGTESTLWTPQSAGLPKDMDIRTEVDPARLRLMRESVLDRWQGGATAGMAPNTSLAIPGILELIDSRLAALDAADRADAPAAPAETPADAPAPVDEALLEFMGTVYEWRTNEASPQRLRALVKKAQAAEYISERDAAEVLRIQKELGSKKDTSDAMDEFISLLEHKAVPGLAPVETPADAPAQPEADRRVVEAPFIPPADPQTLFVYNLLASENPYEADDPFSDQWEFHRDAFINAVLDDRREGTGDAPELEAGASSVYGHLLNVLPDGVMRTQMTQHLDALRNLAAESSEVIDSGKIGTLREIDNYMASDFVPGMTPEQKRDLALEVLEAVRDNYGADTDAMVPMQQAVMDAYSNIRHTRRSASRATKRDDGVSVTEFSIYSNRMARDFGEEVNRTFQRIQLSDPVLAGMAMDAVNAWIESHAKSLDNLPAEEQYRQIFNALSSAEIAAPEQVIQAAKNIFAHKTMVLGTQLGLERGAEAAARRDAMLPFIEQVLADREDASVAVGQIANSFKFMRDIPAWAAARISQKQVIEAQIDAFGKIKGANALLESTVVILQDVQEITADEGLTEQQRADAIEDLVGRSRKESKRITDQLNYLTKAAAKNADRLEAIAELGQEHADQKKKKKRARDTEATETGKDVIRTKIAESLRPQIDVIVKETAAKFLALRNIRPSESKNIDAAVEHILDGLAGAILTDGTSREASIEKAVNQLDSMSAGHGWNIARVEIASLVSEEVDRLSAAIGNKLAQIMLEYSPDLGDSLADLGSGYNAEAARDYQGAKEAMMQLYARAGELSQELGMARTALETSPGNRTLTDNVAALEAEIQDLMRTAHQYKLDMDGAVEQVADMIAAGDQDTRERLRRKTVNDAAVTLEDGTYEYYGDPARFMSDANPTLKTLTIDGLTEEQTEDLAEAAHRVSNFIMGRMKRQTVQENMYVKDMVNIMNRAIKVRLPKARTQEATSVFDLIRTAFENQAEGNVILHDALFETMERMGATGQQILGLMEQHNEMGVLSVPISELRTLIKENYHDAFDHMLHLFNLGEMYMHPVTSAPMDDATHEAMDRGEYPKLPVLLSLDAEMGDVLLPDARLNEALKQVMPADDNGVKMRLSDLLKLPMSLQDVRLESLVDMVIMETGLTGTAALDVGRRLRDVLDARMMSAKINAIDTSVRGSARFADTQALADRGGWIERMTRLVQSGMLDPTLGTSEQRARWIHEFGVRFHLPNFTAEHAATLHKRLADLGDESMTLYRNIAEEYNAMNVMDADGVYETIHNLYVNSARHRDILRKMGEELSGLSEMSLSKMLTATYYAHALSGFSTQELNFIATFANTIGVLWNAGLSEVRRAKRETGDTSRAWDGFMKGYSTAWNSFKEALAVGSLQYIKTGEMKGADVSKEFARKMDTSALESGAWEKKLGGFTSAGKYLGKTLDSFKYVMRVMIASDYAYSRAANMGTLHRLLLHQANLLGLSEQASNLWVAAHMFGVEGYDLRNDRDVARLQAEVESLDELGPMQRAEFMLRLKLTAAAHADAADQGMDPGSYEYRAWVEETLYHLLPQAFRNEARIMAGRATFNVMESDPLFSPNHRVLQSLGKQAVQAKVKHPEIMTPVVPFISIITTVLNTGLDWFPVTGYMHMRKAEAAVQERARTEAAERKPDAEERTPAAKALQDFETESRTTMDTYTQEDVDYLASQVTTGVALFAGLGLAALAAMAADPEDPWFEITGNGPANLRMKNQMREVGWQEYTVKVGGTRFNYHMTPLATPLVILGSYMDVVKYGDSTGGKASLPLYHALVRSAGALLDQTYMTNASDLMSALSSPNKDQSSRMVAQWFARNAGTMVNPNIFKQVSRMFNNRLYDVDDGLFATVMREIPSPIPLYKRTPRLNALGEDILLGQSSIVTTALSLPFKDQKQLGRLATFNMQPTDSVWNYVARHRLLIPAVTRNTLLNGVPMTAEETYAYTKMRGGILKEWINSRIAGGEWDGLDRETRQQDLSNLGRRASVTSKAVMGSGRYDMTVPPPPELNLDRDGA